MLWLDARYKWRSNRLILGLLKAMAVFYTVFTIFIIGLYLTTT